MIGGSSSASRRATSQAEGLLYAIARINSRCRHRGSRATSRSTVQDAETGQRGYSSTHRANYLAPYEEAIATIHQRLQQRKLAKAGSLPAKQVSELEKSINAKIEELRKTVSLVQSRCITPRRWKSCVAIQESGRWSQFDNHCRKSWSGSGKVVARQPARGADAAIQFRGWASLPAIFLVFLAWAYYRIPQRNDASFRCESGKLPCKRKSFFFEHRGCGNHQTGTRGRITFLNSSSPRSLPDGAPRRPRHVLVRRSFALSMRKPRLPAGSLPTRYWRRAQCLANQTVLLRRDGSQRPIDRSGAPIRESDGIVRGVVLVFRGFTAHKESRAHANSC